jgi:hypothetical protein
VQGRRRSYRSGALSGQVSSPRRSLLFLFLVVFSRHAVPVQALYFAPSPARIFSTCVLRAACRVSAGLTGFLAPDCDPSRDRDCPDMQFERLQSRPLLKSATRSRVPGRSSLRRDKGSNALLTPMPLVPCILRIGGNRGLSPISDVITVRYGFRAEKHSEAWPGKIEMIFLTPRRARIG